MARRYRYEKLEVIGYGGQLGDTDHPFVFSPLYAVKGQDIVFTPPYEETDVDVVSTAGSYTRREFTQAVAEGEATVFPKPFPARPKHVLYVNVGNGSVETVEYLSATEAWQRLTRFADEHRAEGDKLFRAGSHEEALEEYFRTASTSHEAIDFARVLLADPQVVIGKECRKWIAEQGHDPETLCAQIREELAG